MKILVVGGNGLLGRNLVELLSLEHDVFATVRNKSEIKFALKDNVTVLEVDLSKLDTGLLPDDIDAVFYLAQSNRFREFPEGCQDMMAVNVVAPNILAEWAVKNGVDKFVYASSGGVYTNPDKPVKEFFEINANKKLGFYLNSKLSAEMLLKNYAKLFGTFVIVRPFFMYGPGQNRSMLIPRLMENIYTGKPIKIYGDEGVFINPIYITDAANAVANIIDLEGEYIINIAGSEVVSIKELCLKASNLLKREPTFEYIHEEANNLIADIESMEKLLHIPRVKIDNGLMEMVK